ncbi:unknown [Bifidobacterium adolescentis CAG:119]|nr:unknown [Bifidobacterium adolescentis CAG:119]
MAMEAQLVRFKLRRLGRIGRRTCSATCGPAIMSIGSGILPGSGPNSRMSVGLYSMSVYNLVACAVKAMMRESGIDSTRSSKFGCSTTCAMSW